MRGVYGCCGMCWQEVNFGRWMRGFGVGRVLWVARWMMNANAGCKIPAGPLTRPREKGEEGGGGLVLDSHCFVQVELFGDLGQCSVFLLEVVFLEDSVPADLAEFSFIGHFNFAKPL